MKFRVSLDPYDEQRAVLRSDARFRVVAAGRRTGKTTLAGAETACRMASGGADWMGYWIAPTHDIADTGFRLMTDALPDEVIASTKRSPPREIELVNGPRLGFRTVSGGANVSVGLDWVVIDEAAKNVPERTWTQELRPTLSDRDGSALFISTPDGQGWFHDWWHRGQSDDHPDVASWRWSTYANPHVPDSEVDAARTELPERIFEQEYLATFRDDTGGVFDPDPDEYDPDDVEGEAPYRTGVDLARSEDYLAIVTLDGAGRVVTIVRERNLSWPQIQTRVERVADRYPGPVAVDATRDNKVVADLETAGLDVRPVTFTAQRKQALIENLAAALEAGEVTVPAETMLATELEVFEYETTRAGNVRYGAPEGHHDDLVDALAMAYDLRGEAIPAATATFGEGSDTDADFGNSAIGSAIKDQQRRRQGPFG